MLPLLLALGWGDPCAPTLWPDQWKNRLPTPRDRLSVPVGDALGFYASSLAAELKHDPRARFWDGARKVNGGCRRAGRHPSARPRRGGTARLIRIRR